MLALTNILRAVSTVASDPRRFFSLPLDNPWPSFIYIKTQVIWEILNRSDNVCKRLKNDN